MKAALAPGGPAPLGTRLPFTRPAVLISIAAALGFFTWILPPTAEASIQCRLTTEVWETSDIAAHVQTELGSGAAVAEWNAIKDQYGADLSVFYAQIGLANNQSALCTFNGNRFKPDAPTRHYYIKRSDTGPPTGDTYDSVGGTLFLQSYHTIYMPVAATTAYRLGTVRAETDNIPVLLQQEFGVGTLMAEWHTLQSEFASNLPGFYKQTGQSNGQSAFVTRDGERIHISNLHYYATRSDSGYPSGAWSANFGSLYLQSWHGIVMQPIARSTLDSSAPMSETSDIPALLQSAHGAAAVMVDWNEIKAQGAGMLGGFYAATGLLNNQIAWVTRDGSRFKLNEPTRYYYVKRSDSIPPTGDTYDSIGASLYLQSWSGLTIPAIYKLTPPATPVGFSASDNAHTDRVELTWTSGANTVSTKIYRSNDSNIFNASVLAEAATGTSYSDTTALGGKTYYYWIKGRNSVGFSPYSTSDTGTRTYQIALVPASKALSNTGQSYPIAVTCNGAWSATDDQTWVSVSPGGGSGNGTVDVTVTAHDSSVVTRVGTVTIGGQAHVVSQEGVVWPSPAAFRLTPAISETGNITALTTATFGTDATVADWNQIAAQAGGNLPGFYAATGLGNIEIAWVTYNGNRFDPDPLNSDRHYYVMRSDGGPPDGLTYQSTGTLYLQSWKNMTKPVVARMRYQLSCPCGSATDPLDWAQRSFGTEVKIADWDNIKSSFASDPTLFYAHTGLRDGGVAWVQRGGALSSPGGYRYFIQRFDNGPPVGFGTLDQFGSLYLGNWNNLTAGVMTDMSTWNADGYESWIANHAEIPVASRGVMDDPEKDGSPNIMEYASNANPGGADCLCGLMPQAGSGGPFTATFRQSTTASGLDDHIEWSPDLTRWAVSGGLIDGKTVHLYLTVTGGGSGYKSVAVEAHPPKGTKKLFLRRAVMQNP